MTRTLIGLDYEGLGCVKITKGNFDPKTTNDSLRNRFYFNSKWPNQITTPEIETMPFVSKAGSSDEVLYRPVGAGQSDFSMMRLITGTKGAPSERTSYYYRGKLRWPSIRYDMPVISVATKLRSTGRFQDFRMTDRTFGQEYGSAGVLGGYVGTGDQGRWYRQQEVYNLTNSFMVDYSPGELYGNSDRENSLVVWNLPGNNVSLDGPTTTPPTAGKMAVQITSDFCRAAKPGYDARTALPHQLAFDSSGRPLSVVAAGDIALPAGMSTYDAGVTIPENMHIEMSCYDDNSAIYFPMKLTGNNDGYGIEYWPDGSLIRFNNTQRDCRARFVAFAADTLPPTSGSNNVLRQFTSGGEVVTQLLRPGAGANPRFGDIILDSRRPVVQVIADGYFSVPNHTGSMNVPTETVINYDAAGFFPFVKYMSVHGSGLGLEVRIPRVNRRFQNSLSTGGLAGDGSYCQYSASTARFYTAKGTPRYTYYSQSEGVTHRYDDNPIVGIRYFVLGIPTP